MSLSSEIYPLFPILVSKYHLDRSLTDIENYQINFDLKNLQKNSNGNHYTNNTFVLNNINYNNLKNFIISCIDDYIFNLNKIINLKYEITQSWLNITKKGESHHWHQHVNSLISGVFYPYIEEEDMIVFRPPLSFSNFEFEYSEFNLFNSTEWSIPCKENDLILFPSYIPHAVPIVNTKKRISLAFNIFPQGTFGSEKRLTKVHYGIN